MKWREMLIGDFVATGEASIQTGPFGTQLAASSYVEHGIPVINVRNIGYGILRPEKLEFVDDSTADRLSVHSLEIDDIVFGRKGAVDRHYLVNAEAKGWIQGSDCIRLRLASDRVLAKYVSLAFLSRTHLQWMLTQSGNKATMASLNQDIIKRIPITVPPLPTQRRIAEILSAYDDLIENNQRRMKLLEESARLLYQEWFVRLRFPGHEHTKIVDGVPEGWARKKLGEIADVLMGQSPESSLYNTSGIGLPFHQGVSDFNERFVSHRVYTAAELRIADAGSILCSVRAPVGRLNMTSEKIVIGRGLSAMNSVTGNQSFLYYQLRNHFFKEDMIGGGAIFASVTKKDLLEQSMLQPSSRIISAFEALSVKVDSQIQTLDLQTQKLRSARDLLLPRLMNGEIEV